MTESALVKQQQQSVGSIVWKRCSEVLLPVRYDYTWRSPKLWQFGGRLL